MFEDLFDELSKVLAWRWPIADGTIVMVEIEKRRPALSNREVSRLAIVYTFWVGNDGPYGGEGFWAPSFTLAAGKRLREARRKMKVGTRVPVRYRPHDPSVNKLDRQAWRVPAD